MGGLSRARVDRSCRPLVKLNEFWKASAASPFGPSARSWVAARCQIDYYGRLCAFLYCECG